MTKVVDVGKNNQPWKIPEYLISEGQYRDFWH